MEDGSEAIEVGSGGVRVWVVLDADEHRLREGVVGTLERADDAWQVEVRDSEGSAGRLSVSLPEGLALPFAAGDTIGADVVVRLVMPSPTTDGRVLDRAGRVLVASVQSGDLAFLPGLSMTPGEVGHYVNFGGGARRGPSKGPYSDLGTESSAFMVRNPRMRSLGPVCVVCLGLLGCGSAPPATGSAVASSSGAGTETALESCEVVAEVTGPAEGVATVESTDPSAPLDPPCAEACDRLHEARPELDCDDGALVARSLRRQMQMREGTMQRSASCTLVELGQVSERASADTTTHACERAYTAICEGRRCTGEAANVRVQRVDGIMVERLYVTAPEGVRLDDSTWGAGATACELEVDVYSPPVEAHGSGPVLRDALVAARTDACAQLGVRAASCTDEHVRSVGTIEVANDAHLVEPDLPSAPDVQVTIMMATVTAHVASATPDAPSRACPAALAQACEAAGGCSGRTDVRLVHGVPIRPASR